MEINYMYVQLQKPIPIKPLQSYFSFSILHIRLPGNTQQDCQNIFISTVIQMENPQSQPQPIPQHTRFQFSQPKQPQIYFNSCFDSGNMHRVSKISYDHYGIWTACDAQGTDNEGYPKSWFYFQAGGFMNRRVTFSIHRVHFLYAMVKKHHLYRPVIRINYHQQERSEWLRLPHPVLSLAIMNEGVTLKFDYFFGDDVKSVEFAFIYPYTYQNCREDVAKLKEEYENDKEVFLQQYELTKSYEGRIIDCVVISSHEGKEGYESIKGTPFENKKIVKFRSNKPIIFISARVHPIQTPSSYCMSGIIKFLLDKKDMRAHLLRKYFVFVLVPMLNPDGVARGHCRMDILNQNLNRYYTDPDIEKQPSCYAIKKLCEHYTIDKRLFMYLDLHAHPALKGNFTFGNAIYQFIQQVESQIFPKMLSENCINFQFQQCIFSRKHMKAKDRNEDETKEGCGRVVLYKEFGIVHSYTLQCGYHMNTFNNELQPQKNTGTRYLVRYRLNQKNQKIYDNIEKPLSQERYNRMIQTKEKPKNSDVFQFTPHSLDNQQDEYYKRDLPTYNIETFYNLGRNIVVTLLDIWNKNPYTRLDDLNVHRKEIAERQAKLDRFRKEQAGIKTKQKRIVELIEEQFYGDWHKRNVFNPVSFSQQRDKKRNNTLQAQKLNISRPTKSQKSEKTVKVQQNEEKRQKNGQTIETDQIQVPYPSTIKLTLNQCKEGSTELQHDKSLQSRAGGKNFKLSRINFAASLNHNEKQSNRLIGAINRQTIGTQLKISMENELPKGNNETLSVHSKVMKIPNFNACNLRVRNMVAAVRASEEPNLLRTKALFS